MNYAAIYRDFISNRKNKEGALIASGQYLERHHVIPKSMGGQDDAENILALTPEDHYFAHLLLAHIHGGWAWTTVKAMCHGFSKAQSKWRRNRPLYGVARRKWAEFARIEMKRKFHAGELVLRKGKENNKFNHEEFSWVNLDTQEKRAATLHAMHQEFGGSRSSWTLAMNGRRKTALGWKLETTVVRIRGYKGKLFKFVNRDGGVFSGTQADFCQHVGLSPASGTRVCRDASVTRCGWRLESTDDRSHSAQKANGTPARLDVGKFYEFSKDGEIRSGKISVLSQLFGSTKQQLHAGIFQIRVGKMASYKGWCLLNGEKQADL